MIYNIHGFQQKQLIKHGLDNDDALILRAITGMYASAKMEFIIHEGDRYIWVNQDYLTRQVKLMGSKKKIVRRINKMIEKGLLASKTVHSKKGVAGTFYYIKPLPLLDTLRDIEPYPNMSGPDDKKGFDGRTKCPSKDSNNNNDSNITNIYSTIYRTWQESGIIKHERLTNTMKNKIRSALKEYTEEEICRSIKNYGNILNDPRSFFEYKWTLNEFCTLGQKDRILQFIDLDIAKGKFYTDQKGETNGINNSTGGIKQKGQTTYDWREWIPRD